MRSFLNRNSKIIFLFILLIFSCGPEAKENNFNQLVVGIEANPTNLDPRLALDLSSARVTQLIYNGLLKKDINLKLVPDLCEKWEMIDSLTYIFYLRKGIKFHDGVELKSSDVKFTLESILNPRFKSPRKESFSRIKKIEIIDPYTLKIKLVQAFAPFLENMLIGIVPKHLAENNFDLSNHPLGTGPYKFKTWSKDEKIEFTAHRDYFEGSPRIKKIIYRIIPDETVRLLELEKGNIDLVQNAVSPDFLPRIKKNPSLKIIRREGTNYSYLGFNLRDPILKKQKVREAFAYALDRKGIIKYILKNQVAPARGILSPANWAYEAQVKQYNYNPRKAASLLDEAGYPDPDGKGPLTRFNLIYKTSQNESRKLIAMIIQEQLKKIGVGMEINAYEWGKFFADIRSGNFQLFSLTWVGITDPDIYYYIFHSRSIPPQGANRGFYLNPQLDKLLEEGRITLEEEKRKLIYAKVQKIIAEDLPYLNLWHSTNIAIMKKELEGFTVYPDENFTTLKKVYWKKR